MRIKVFVIIYSISVWITSFIFSQNDIKYFRKFSIDRRFCQIELKYPVSNSFYNKMSCYQVKYDDINRIQKIDFLEQGKLAIDNFGFTMFTIEYLDSLEKRSYFDKLGNPTLNRDGIHSYTLKKNLNDHPIQFINYDKNGEITKDKNDVSIYQFGLDEADRIIKVNFLNNSFDSIVDANGWYYKKYLWNEDKSTYIFEISCFNIANRLIENSDGVAINQSKFDKKNKELIEQSYYDTNRALKVSKQYNAAKILAKYDLKGNEIERKFYGIDGKLTNSNQGYSIIRQKFNSYGKVIEIRLFGTDEKLISGTKKELNQNGFAIIKYEYDENGNNSRISFYDNVEKLVQKTSQIAIKVYTYDDKNRKTTESLYNAKNQLIISENGCITYWKYDNLDNIIEEQHFGQDYKLKENKRGIAMIHWNYDEEGKLLNTQFFNSNEKFLFENLP